MKVKCISLWQSWASLWAAGIKIHETRGWSMTHRGLLAVHAAKHKDIHGAALWGNLLVSTTPALPDSLKRPFERLPFGAIVGVVEIVDCIPVEKLGPISKLERMLGDYSPGRFAWPAVNARLFKDPIQWKGQQGFFTVEIPDSKIVHAYQSNRLE